MSQTPSGRRPWGEKLGEWGKLVDGGRERGEDLEISIVFDGRGLRETMGNKSQ